MATVVTSDTVSRVKELLSHQTPYSQIAEIVGVSQGTVGTIAKGHRDHLLKKSRRRRPPEGHAYCRQCESIAPSPCPRCAKLEAAAMAAEAAGQIGDLTAAKATRSRRIKWTDNVAPLNPGDDELFEMLAAIVDIETPVDPGERWTLAEGGKQCSPQ